MENTEILIVGAGAAGLMAARELSRAGKKVVILEARDRIGGRVWPLSKEEFGYPAEGGAEFVHGEAPVTKEVIKEAGLTYTPMEDGELWSVRGKEIIKGGGPTENQDFVLYQDLLHDKLGQLEKDIPISVFLDKHFKEDKYHGLRDSIIRMVEDYDAGDPERISTFTLREEWLGAQEWKQGRIKEGYGPLIEFLAEDCRKNGVEIITGQEVESVETDKEGVRVTCAGGKKYNCDKIIITVSLPILQRINFEPAIPEKMAAAKKIGFGSAIKILFRFKSQWWLDVLGKDLSKMTFILSKEIISPWWTQYPESRPVLTGWIAGPKARKFVNASQEEMFELALQSLADTFQVSKDSVREQLVASKIINWPADPFSRGAYSYSTVETKEAYEELSKPVDGRIFFAGEALYSGKETATVEGALASGKETAELILKK